LLRGRKVAAVLVNGVDEDTGPNAVPGEFEKKRGGGAVM